MIQIGKKYITKGHYIMEIIAINPVTKHYQAKRIYPAPTEAFHNFIRYRKSGKRPIITMDDMDNYDIIDEFTKEKYPEFCI